MKKNYKNAHFSSTNGKKGAGRGFSEISKHSVLKAKTRDGQIEISYGFCLVWATPQMPKMTTFSFLNNSKVFMCHVV